MYICEDEDKGRRAFKRDLICDKITDKLKVKRQSVSCKRKFDFEVFTEISQTYNNENFKFFNIQIRCHVGITTPPKLLA